MAIEKIADIPISASPGAKKNGEKGKVLKLRIPYHYVRKLHIIRSKESKAKVPMYIEPPMEEAIRTGKFRLIYEFDTSNVEKKVVIEKKEEEIEIEEEITSDDFNIDNIIDK